MKDFESRLENIFSEQRKQTERLEMPEGHTGRFQRKLEQQKPSFIQRLSGWFNDHAAGQRIGWVLSPAICILAVVLLISKSSPEQSLRQMELSYRTSLMQMGSSLTEDSRQLPKGFQEDALYSISSILDEDEQLMALQLPENLSKTEKQKIIKEYYNQKMEGLKRIKTFIAMNDNDSE